MSLPAYSVVTLAENPMRERINRKIRELVPWLILAVLAFIAITVYELERPHP